MYDGCTKDWYPGCYTRNTAKKGVWTNRSKAMATSNAIDRSPVVPSTDKHFLGREIMIPEDTLDLSRINARMAKLVEELARQLREQKKLATMVTIMIRYADHQIHTGRLRIACTSMDKVIHQHVKELFHSVHKRRQLIRQIGVKLSGLVSGQCQLDLFENREEEIRLIKEIDQIKKRFGNKVLQKAAHLS